jgi:hypothetical protein
MHVLASSFWIMYERGEVGETAYTVRRRGLLIYLRGGILNTRISIRAVCGSIWCLDEGDELVQRRAEDLLAL